jgi:hypothetical protein
MVSLTLEPVPPPASLNSPQTDTHTPDLCQKQKRKQPVIAKYPQFGAGAYDWI